MLDAATTSGQMTPGQAGTAPAAPGTGAGSRFTILGRHAEGGLGRVYLARDEQLHRTVALKEIRPGQVDQPQVRQRFLAEAEITGQLEHPGIVPIYALEQDAAGRPTYAMRFIQGRTLEDAINAAHELLTPLGLRELLQRFIAVCQTVAYAHSRGVIHRDLKPQNVMLGDYGETLVVDWGLAKRLGAEAPAPALATPPARPTEDAPTQTVDYVPPEADTGGGEPMTTAGQVLGTPSYMAPEQARGEVLGPAADVYALGAILYKTLTGQAPYQGRTGAEVLEQVRAAPPPAPVARSARVPRALNAVCLKAMAREARDRYATAGELTREVERWLADEPVAAYAEPWTARAARWARRHRTAVAAVGVLLVSVVIALFVSTALVWREQRNTAEHKRLAEHNFALARDLSYHGIELVASDEAAFAAVPAQRTARTELLKSAARVFREYLEQQPNDPDLRQRTARVYRYAANAQRYADETEAAAALYRDAIRLQEGLVQQYPEDAGHRKALAETLRDYGPLQVRLGRLREAADTLRRAVDVSEALAAGNRDQASNRRNLATALLDLCNVQYDLGLVTESGKSAARSVELFRALVQLPPNESHPYNPVLLAAALTHVAVVQRDSGKLDEAAATHQEAVELLEGLVTKRPVRVSLADIQHFRAACQLEYAKTLAKIPARHKNAEPTLSAAIDQWEKLAKAFAKSPRYRQWLGAAYQGRGQFRADEGRLGEARADFEQSRRLLEASVKESPQLPALRGDLGRTYAGLARVARRSGDAPAAAEGFAKATEALRYAVDRSPDHAHDRRSLEEVLAERK